MFQPCHVYEKGTKSDFMYAVKGFHLSYDNLGKNSLLRFFVRCIQKINTKEVQPYCPN